MSRKLLRALISSPLNQDTRQQLQLLQQELGLSNKIVASIEARVTSLCAKVAAV